MDRGWVQSMQNVDNIYIITEGEPKETKYLPTRESTTSLIWISMVYCDKTDGGKTWFSSCGIMIIEKEVQKRARALLDLAEG